jgi:phage terminase large subunit-like protein
MLAQAFCSAAIVERQNITKALMDKIGNPTVREQLKKEGAAKEEEWRNQISNLREELKRTQDYFIRKNIPREEWEGN